MNYHIFCDCCCTQLPIGKAKQLDGVVISSFVEAHKHHRTIIGSEFDDRLEGYVKCNVRITA